MTHAVPLSFSCVVVHRSHLASGSDDQTVKLWDTDAAACLRSLEGHTGYVRSVAFSRNGVLASSADDGCVRFWAKRRATRHPLDGERKDKRQVKVPEQPPVVSSLMGSRKVDFGRA